MRNYVLFLVVLLGCAKGDPNDLNVYEISATHQPFQIRWALSDAVDPIVRLRYCEGADANRECHEFFHLDCTRKPENDPNDDCTVGEVRGLPHFKYRFDDDRVGYTNFVLEANKEKEKDRSVENHFDGLTPEDFDKLVLQIRVEPNGKDPGPWVTDR